MTMREGLFQPDRFERYVPVMAMEQRDQLLLTVPYLCQYNNCNVVVTLLEHPSASLLYSDCSLTMGDREVSKVAGGGGPHEHRFRFIVTPPIPDEQATRLPMTFHVDPGVPPLSRRRETEPITLITPTTIQFHGGSVGG